MALDTATRITTLTISLGKQICPIISKGGFTITLQDKGMKKRLRVAFASCGMNTTDGYLMTIKPYTSDLNYVEPISLAGKSRNIAPNDTYTSLAQENF